VEQGAEEFPNEVLELVRTSFPAPIAMVCRAFLIERAPERRFKRMLDLFEATMLFSVYLLIGVYRSLANQSQSGLKPLSDVLKRKGLKPLTLGEFEALFNRLVGILVQQRDDTSLPRLFQRFRNNNPMVIKHFIDLRNRFAHGGLQGSTAYEQFIRDYEPKLIEMFLGLQFLTETRLVWVEDIKLRGGHYVHVSKLCMGDNPLFRWWEFDAPIPLDREKLWVIKGEEFTQAIPLHPLVIMAHCEECGQEEIFFYNKYEKGNAVYINYFPGHRLTTARYLAELAEVFGRKRVKEG